MNFSDYLTQSAKDINQQIELFFQQWRKEVKKISPKLLPLIDTVIDATEGGKRLRAVLVKLGYELVASDINPQIYKPAVAFEIFQTAILAHDDIMDQSPLRRGRPTIYKQLGGDHYAISQTISLGDIGFFLATKIIADSNFPKEYITKAVSIFNKSMIDTAFGQILDVATPFEDNLKTEDNAIFIATHKTARYTIVGPLQLGAVLAGAEDNLLLSIKQFGDNLGVAFQIQDDILGVFGDEKEVGKSVTSDIEEGKNTLLITYAKKHCSKSQRSQLDQLYGTGPITAKDHQIIKNIFIATESLQYAQNRAEYYIIQAKKIIPKLTKDPKKAILLEQMSDFLVKRKK